MSGIDFEKLRGAVDLFEDAARVFAGEPVDRTRSDAALGDLEGLFAKAAGGLAVVRDGDLAAGIARIAECRIYEALARLAGGDPETAIGAVARAFEISRAGGNIDAATRSEAARALGDMARRIRCGKVAW